VQELDGDKTICTISNIYLLPCCFLNQHSQGYNQSLLYFCGFLLRHHVAYMDVGDFVPFRFRAITISCHFGDFVPPIGFIGVYCHTYEVLANDVIYITIDM